MLEMKIKHGKETYWNEDKNNEAILDVDQEQICVERWSMKWALWEKKKNYSSENSCSPIHNEELSHYLILFMIIPYGT